MKMKILKSQKKKTTLFHIYRTRTFCNCIYVSHTQHYIYIYYVCVITISYTPCRDTAISPRGGIYLSSTTPHTLLRLRQCYPTLPNYFFITTTLTAQLNKLPLTTIIFIIIDGIIRFNNHKIQTHALGSICIRRGSI